MMLLGLAALFAAFLLSSHFMPWTSFHQEVAAAAGAALLGAAALLHARDWRWPPIAIAAALAALAALAQALLGQPALYAGDSLLAALYLAAFALSIAAGAALARSRRADLLDGLNGVFVAASIVSTGFALSQWLDVDIELLGVAPLQGRRAYANLAQPNHLASLLLMGLAGAAYFFQTRRIGPTILTTLALVFCLGIALTQSRQAWIGLAIVAVIVWALRERTALAIPRWAGAALLPLVAVMLALAEPAGELMQVSPARSADELLSRGTRLTHWQAMLDAVSREPWWGYGWNEVPVAHSRVAADHPASFEMIDHSHNLLIDLMVWTGVPLGLLMFAALVWWFWHQLRGCRDPAAAYWLVALGVLFTHSLFEYPLSYAYFLLPAGLMMGAVSVIGRADAGSKVPRAASAALLALAVAGAGLVVHEYLQIDADHRQMRTEKLIVSAYRAPESAPQVLVLRQWREFLVVARSQARPDMAPADLAQMKRVRDRFPQPPVLMRYALAAGLNGQPDEAGHALVTLCKIHVPARCEEGRTAWAAAALTFPQLLPRDFPSAAPAASGR